PCSTRAVMPTLVAVRVVLRNVWTYADLSGRIHAPTAQPSAKGATTPKTATRTEGLQHVRDGRLKADLEQENDQTEAREDFNRRIGLDAVNRFPQGPGSRARPQRRVPQARL